MTNWQYCVLSRLSAGIDTKWGANRVFQHSETGLPEEETADEFRQYNARFDELHARKVYPILPAVLNIMGADGWELIDDMNTGITDEEGLVFKRPVANPPAASSSGSTAAGSGSAASSASPSGR